MEFLRSANNQHVGVNLKARAIIMMDAFCYCTSSELLSVERWRAKTASWWNQAVFCMKSRIYSVLSGLFWSTIAKLHYRPSHAVYLAECWSPLAGFPQRRDGCVYHRRDTVQSERGRCRHLSFLWKSRGGIDTRLTPLSVWDKEGREDSLHRWIHL